MRDAFQAEGLTKLCQWANEAGANGKAVEIGSYSGEGTVVIAKHFKDVLAVDPWLNGYDINDGECITHERQKPRCVRIF